MSAPDLRSDETKAIDNRIALARAGERERCAKIAEQYYEYAEKNGLTFEGTWSACHGIADRIREQD